MAFRSPERAASNISSVIVATLMSGSCSRFRRLHTSGSSRRHRSAPGSRQIRQPAKPAARTEQCRPEQRRSLRARSGTPERPASGFCDKMPCYTHMRDRDPSSPLPRGSQSGKGFAAAPQFQARMAVMKKSRARRRGRLSLRSRRSERPLSRDAVGGALRPKADARARIPPTIPVRFRGEQSRVRAALLAARVGASAAIRVRPPCF